jgi:predicted house-cleaning noncanonical NTP pyrophosphatase (MazG superfamily)
MIKEIEKTCENCEYEYEDIEGTHCRHCIHNATENFKPKTENDTVKKIREDAIDEFAERLKKKILEEIDDVSESQRNYEVGSEMSITCSHIMGSLRDVHHRIIDKIAEQMKGSGKNDY